MLVGEWQTLPEAARARRADELGIPIGDAVSAARDTEGTGQGAGVVDSGVTLSAEDVMRMLLIKGAAAPGPLAESLNADQSQVSALLADLSGSGLAEATGDDLRLTRTASWPLPNPSRPSARTRP